MEIAGLDIKFLPGVGNRKAAVLDEELGIRTYEDMLYHIPYKYIDRSRIYKISELNPNFSYIQIKAKIRDLRSVGSGKSLRLTAIAYDESGDLELVWFKGLKYIPSQIDPGKEYLIFGQPTVFNHRINIVHPELDDFEKSSSLLVGFQALYHTTEKMKKSFLHSKAIHKIISNIFSHIGKIPETLPAWFIAEHKLMYLHDALYNVHFPTSPELLKRALYRLKFEELFYIQLNILKMKFRRKTYFKGCIFSTVGKYFNDFYMHYLPFPLTNAQKRVIKEIRQDCGSGKQMNRLLQGDVGSGKTLVALMSMLIALDNGYQACIMAPTEILANQHFVTICELLKDLDIRVGLLTGSTRKKERQLLHEQLNDGTLQIIVGTHALLEDVVQFRNIGLVVIDEQHRFGVAQRAKLWQKNNDIPPHILVMTATPIPRTLAMTLYGDLDVSVIDELPPGRKPISTIHTYENNREETFRFIEKELKKGRQAYIVYPLISESEKMDYRNLEMGYEMVSRFFKPLGYAVSMVHGKMKNIDKESEMQLFVRNETQILVATTVIEVGVNVPNASVMLIESAERFGLSQLHQLRGRVGRGADQSYCILMTSFKVSQDSHQRINTMTSTNDGFEIAEADLKLRGPGDLEGTQQSGLVCNLKVANLGKDGLLLNEVSKIAGNILQSDPELTKEENFPFTLQLKRIFKTKLNWRFIS